MGNTPLGLMLKFHKKQYLDHYYFSTLTWPSKINLITCKTICRWLPTTQINQNIPRPNQFPNDLDELQVWVDKWGMKFNASKCQIKRIHRSTKPLEIFYILNKPVLIQVDKAKYLGMMITKHLDWSTYIKCIVTNANRCFGFIKRNVN